MNFALDVSKFRDKAMNQANTVIRKTGLEVGRRIILRTPVDTGRARGNWIPQVNSPANGQTETLDKSGAISIASLASTVSTWKPISGVSLFVVNNLPYIEVLEKGRIGNKGSNQAPRGMVAITVAEFQNIVEASV
jgi:hypothetical protein